MLILAKKKSGPLFRIQIKTLLFKTVPKRLRRGDPKQAATAVPALPILERPKSATRSPTEFAHAFKKETLSRVILSSLTEECQSHHNVVYFPEESKSSEQSDDFIGENEDPQHSAEKAGNCEQKVSR